MLNEANHEPLEMKKSQEEIHSKGFDIINSSLNNIRTDDVIDYNKIKLGVKTLEDAVLNLGDIPKIGNRRVSKGMILQALAEKNLPLLRSISEQFYNISGIYERACNYLAFLYRYDWYIIPEIYEETGKVDKIIKEYVKILNFLDSSYIKKTCGDIALKVVKYGCYYGYIVPSENNIIIQELPQSYCRTRGSVNGSPIVEFNMAFFDEKFPDIQYRQKVLKLFPEEFQKGYILYKKNKLKLEDQIELNDGFDSFNSFCSATGWYVLDPEATVKFNLNGSDIPVLAAAIPSILDLDAAQDLDRRKQMQQLLKIIVQRLPLDKNGDLIFDVDEARDIHNNTVQMLKRAIGVDVMTTFAEVSSINTNDKNTTATQDELAKVERALFNAMGLSKNLFNTEGNMALEKSILDDESVMRDLLLQFAIFFDKILQRKNSNRKKYAFRFYMLETTQYNYKELAKMYKEQVANGYSKILPHVAMGHPQSSILNTAYFENEVLHLPEMMLPPLMSSTMSVEELLAIRGQGNSSNSQKTSESNKKVSSQTKSASSGQVGRPEKPDDQKSEKTIQNKESMS